MDGWRWLQHERAERPPNHRLPNAASSGRDESASARELVSGVHAFWSPGGPIWFGVPYRDALKFTFTQLPGNNGVDVSVVHNDEL
jgi:hypothetical protein